MRNMAERDVQLQDLEGAGRGENTSVDGVNIFINYIKVWVYTKCLSWGL